MMRDLLPLAEGTQYRDFESEVLEGLKRHGAAMHGCPIWKVEVKKDGGIAIWFKGPRDGIEWEGALKFSFPLLNQRKWAWDVSAVTNCALQLAARATEQSKGQRFFQRASG